MKDENVEENCKFSESLETVGIIEIDMGYSTEIEKLFIQES